MAPSIVSGTTNSAFTLVEVLVAIILIGLVGALFTGLRFGSVTPASEAKTFVARINKLMQYGVRSAISTGQLHRVIFDFKNNQIRLEQKLKNASDRKGKEAHKDFGAVSSELVDTVLPLDNVFEIENVYIEGNKDEIRATGTTNDVWFYITPDGLTQRVVINVILRGLDGETKKEFSMKLNPFYGIFSFYDEFLPGA